MHSKITGRRARWKALFPAIFIFFAIGILLNSRHLGSQQEVEYYDAYLEAGIPPLPNVTRRKDFWERSESSCLHVDNICSRNGSGWFYGPSRWYETAHQPTTVLVQNKKEIGPVHGHDIQIDKRIYLNVSSTSHDLYDDDTCTFSPTPHHMVVQSAYNHMIGEFYSRSLLALNQWLRDYPPRARKDVQMYIHFVDKRKKMLEGHRLFLGGLPNNNKFDNFLSLMPDDSCRCFRKLIFCGYDVENATASSVLTDNSKSIDTDENAIVFKPRSVISNPKTQCLAKDANCHNYRNLQRDLMDTYSDKDHDLDQKIRQYQRQILVQKGLISNNTSSVGDWKFVGLAHRKYRRIWLNIDDTISMCDQKFRRYNIICIKIDVEEAESPEEQLLMHRSLNAFIGVHGAQLTQGVLLPKHGYILELLPWVPFYLWGVWVATTHAPTPLGIIFRRTHLNHVGYPLGRESVPLCLHVDAADEENTKSCLMNETSGVLDKFRWADRDFIVPLEVIEDFISSFLLRKKNNLICDDMQERAEQKNFVLYNAFCRQNRTEHRLNTAQYYRKKDEAIPKNIHEHMAKHGPK